MNGARRWFAIALVFLVILTAGLVLYRFVFFKHGTSSSPMVLAQLTGTVPTVSLSTIPTVDLSNPASFIVITETPIPTPTRKPTPTPTRTPTPIPAGSLEGWFSQYAQEYQVSSELLKKIGWCESHLNSGANNGSYGGMFQFTIGAWVGARVRMGADPNPDLRFHGQESIRTAAFKVSRDGTSAWKNCTK